MSELDDAVDAVQAGLDSAVTSISGISDQLADAKSDLEAAIAKLQSGQDVSGAIAKLKAMATQLGSFSTSLGSASDSIKALDATLEGITGVQTPPPPTT